MQPSDVCFSGSSFAVLVSVATTLIGAISTLFGFLMLSYRGRIVSAEAREAQARENEKAAYTARDLAVTQRDEAHWRLQNTRQQYREFVEENLPERKSSGRRRLGEAPS